jgi:hypothetical protein
MAVKLMVIRHGEKPSAPSASSRAVSHGLLESGEHPDYGLTVQGWQRAGAALAVLFGREGAWSLPTSSSHLRSDGIAGACGCSKP